MKPAQRLRLEPRPSRIAGAALGSACLLAATLLALLPLPSIVVAAGIAGAGTTLARGLWQCWGRGVPALVHVGLDRRIAVTDRTGRTQHGTILDDTYVGAALTVIAWSADGDRWWRPVRSILVLPDVLTCEEFRALRVVLRYGRPARRAETSGVEAG